MKGIFTGLLIVFVLVALVAGALACWHTSEPHVSPYYPEAIAPIRGVAGKNNKDTYEKFI